MQSMSLTFKGRQYCVAHVGLDNATYPLCLIGLRATWEGGGGGRPTDEKKPWWHWEGGWMNKKTIYHKSLSLLKSTIVAMAYISH